MRYTDSQFLGAIEAGALTTAEIAALVGCSIRTAQRRLSQMEGQGRVVRRCRGRAYVWAVVSGPGALTAETVAQRIAALREQGLREQALARSPEERLERARELTRQGLLARWHGRVA